MNASAYYKPSAIAFGLSTILTLPVLTFAATDTASPFTWGADLRLRQEIITPVGFNEDSSTAYRSFERYRTRLWGGYEFNQQIALNARLMWEGRHYNQPAGFEPWYEGGVFFDILTVDLKPIATLPLSFKIGRQEIKFGNGWLILEGTPLDGSRTTYFDAARATYTLEQAQTAIDLIYIDHNADTGRFPQPLDGNVEDNTEQHETGAILYLNNKSILKGGDLDGYFIYKHNNPNNTVGSLRENNGTLFPSPADTGDIYAIGMRADTPLNANWQLRSETVYEWGTRNNCDLDSYGFNSRLTYQLNDPLKNALHVGYEYLSGDDPDSNADETFDPLWGRWPQWSELLAYEWQLENRIGEATNLQRLNIGWEAKPHNTTTVTLDYHALWANENSTRSAAQMLYLNDDEKFRGHLFAGWIKTKLDKHVAGHLVAEYLMNGEYFAEPRQDNAYFVRAEVTLTW